MRDRTAVWPPLVGGGRWVKWRGSNPRANQQSEAHTHDRIFISARDGKPLNDNSLSQIFGDASRAIGLGPGHAIHMLRFKNVDDRIAGEIESRVALGLDTSTQSIAASVSMEVGHSNPESLWSYVSQSQSKIAQRKKALKIDSGGSTKN